MPSSRPTWGSPCSVNGGYTRVTFSNGTNVTVASEIAQLIKLLADETIARGYEIRNADTGGYNCRNIGGTSSWSNHAWGLAVDLNWNCLSGDTVVLTAEGRRRLEELAAEGEATLWTADPMKGGMARLTTAPVRSFGVAPVLAVTTSRYGSEGETIRATANHRWFVYRDVTLPRSDRPGHYRQLRRVKEVTTADLRPGDRLVMAGPRSEARRSKPCSIGVAAGNVFGDGSLSRTSGAIVDLFGMARELLRFYPEPVVYSLPDHPDAIRVANLPRSFKKLPPLDESTQYLVGWLAGYIAADGSVTDTGNVSLKIYDDDIAAFVVDLCVRLGVKARCAHHKHETDFGVGTHNIITFARDSLGPEFFVRSDQRDRFEENEVQRRLPSWKVESVVDAGEEEVFCPTVEETGAFVLDGWMLTGNSNPFVNPLTTDMPGWMVDLWTQYGFRWGGTYTSKKDAMHYEFMGTMADAATFTAKALADGIGGGQSAPVPSGATVQPSGGGTARRGVYTIQSTDADGFIAVVCRCTGLTEARWKLRLGAARRVARVNDAAIDNVWKPGDEVEFPRSIRGVRTYKVEAGDGLIAIAKGLGLGDDEAAQQRAAEINAWQGDTPQPDDIWFGGPA